MEEGTWAAQKHSEAGDGRPVDRGVWTAKTVKRPRQQPAHPQYANYWAPLTRKRHTMPRSAQSQHANYWAPRTRKRHQQEHRPQRPTESSDPTQHAKGRTGDRPGPRKGATTRRNVTQGGRGALVCAQTPAQNRMSNETVRHEAAGGARTRLARESVPGPPRHSPPPPPPLPHPRPFVQAAAVAERSRPERSRINTFHVSLNRPLLTRQPPSISCQLTSLHLRLLSAVPVFSPSHAMPSAIPLQRL